MSYNSWHIYGYGLCVSDIEGLSIEKIQALLAKAPKYQKDVQGWLEEHDISEPTVDDYLEFDQDYCLGLASILTVLFSFLRYRIFNAPIESQ